MKLIIIFIFICTFTLKSQLSTYGNLGMGYSFYAKNVIDISINSRINFLTFNESKSSIGVALNPSILFGTGNTNDPSLSEKYFSYGYALPFAIEFHSGRHNCKELDENDEDIKFGYFGGIGYAFSSINTLTSDRTAKNNSVVYSYPTSGIYLNGGIWYNHTGLRIAYLQALKSGDPSLLNFSLMFKLIKSDWGNHTHRF
jgi:hypothetical protein